MITVFERRAAILENPFELDFTWDRSRAFTVDYKAYNKLLSRGKGEQKNDRDDGRSDKDRYLIIDSYCEIEVYDRITELAAVTRPRILVILGIITFVTGKALTPFGFASSFTNIVSPGTSNPVTKPSLHLDGHDFSDDLNEMLTAMQAMSAERQILIFSLIDRWRKACYLEEENEDSFLYKDETILACFHILELLAEQYGDTIDQEIQERAQAFTADVLENVLFIKNNQAHADLAKLVNSALTAHKTVKPKILRMFKELGLLQPKSKALVERFLAHRNAIAHGRENLYEAKAAIYPLKPFFNHLKDIYEDIDTIRIVSARAIAAFLGTALWQDEWKELVDMEVPVYEDVQLFNRAREYEAMNWQEIETGNARGVNIAVLIHYYRKGIFAIQPFTMALAKHIKEVQLSDDNAYAVLYAAAILSDSGDEHVAAAAQGHIAVLYDGDLVAKPRDQRCAEGTYLSGQRAKMVKILSDRTRRSKTSISGLIFIVFTKKKSAERI